MRYPKNIKKGDYIGVTAPSAGITIPEKVQRLDNASKNIQKLGYNYIETKNVRCFEKGRSSSGEERAKQFMELWNNSKVTAIIPATGGDFLAEMIDYLDFNELKNTEPKWIQGYSDITTLNFLFTTILDIATIYCDNIKSYGMEPLYKNLTDAISIMEGKKVVQHSFEKYEIEDADGIFAPYNLTKESKWVNLNYDKINFSGRSIGGCLDVIANIIGTKYDKIGQYIEKYKKDGIIWFLEVYEMSSPQVYLRLWQMKNAGYFENCKGIIFGRPLMIREDYEISFQEAVRDALGNLDIPIICEADIGHVAPQMPIVCGAILEVESYGGKGKVITTME